MFVAQDQEDYDTLNRLLNDSEGQVLRKGARVNTWFRQHGSIAGPPMTPAEVRFHLPPLSHQDLTGSSTDETTWLPRLRYRLCRLSGRPQVVLAAGPQLASNGILHSCS
jgi:hypothetical protein